VRKLTRDRWIPAFDSASPPAELIDFLIAEHGVSVWECLAEEDTDSVVVNIVAGYDSRPPSFLLVAEIDEAALDSLHLALRHVPDHEAPVERLGMSHRELPISTDEEAAHFVALVREAARRQFSRTQIESAIVSLYDSGQLMRNRCGKFALAVLDRDRSTTARRPLG